MMYNFRKKVKQRFVLFVSISAIAFVCVFFFIKSFVLTKNNDPFLINKSGRQRMLSQRITKSIFALDSRTKSISANEIDDSLRSFTKEIKESHKFLFNNYKKSHRTKRLDSLFDTVDDKLEVLVKYSDSIVLLKFFATDKKTKAMIKETELSFLFGMDAIVYEYQKKAEANFKRIEQSFYISFLVFALILIGAFIFLWLFNIRALIEKNESLEISNEQLARSKLKFKENLKIEDH